MIKPVVMKRFLEFIRKEFFHILRDRRTLLILLGIPIAQIILFGFAISTEVKDVRVAVFAPELDNTVRRMINDVEASEYFIISSVETTYSNLDEVFDMGKADVALLFPVGFESSLMKGEQTVQIVVDAVEPNAALARSNYLSSVLSMSLTAMFPEMQKDMPEVSIRMLYNPQMKSAFNFVPGVMGLILMLICAMMTSISIVREKETGTMEVLLVSPVNTFMMIIAKAVPYFILSVVNLLTILLLSVTLLKVPVNGSLMLLFGISFVFILVSLALGLLISCITTTQVAAMLTSGMVLMMPTMILSGMIFPLESIPVFLQYVSYCIPARWYIEAVRRVMIEGTGFMAIADDFIVLSCMAVVLILASALLLKKRLE